MKILHMTPPDINNGVYRYIFNHMRYMEMGKYEFAFLTKGAEELRRTEEYRQYGFQVHTLHNRQRDSREGLRSEIIRVLCQGYDVIHLHTSSWRGFLIEETAMEMGIRKVIVHSHSTGIDVADGAEREKQLREHERYKKQFTMEYATDVCACSGLAADWLFGPGIPREVIRILPNAIDVGKYRFCPEIREKIRRRLNLEKRIVIGNVGRYSYQKNQEFLVRVFADAHARNSSLFLLCVGEGEFLKYLRRMIEELGIENSALCMEWQENVEDYLQAMDVFCLPSRFEGLPISVVEAQASGLKCLVSDCVTREVKITDLVKFLPLKKESWVEELAGCRIERERGWMDEWFERADYSMEASCRKLARLYE